MKLKPVKMLLRTSLIFLLTVTTVCAEEIKRMPVSEMFELVKASNEIQCKNYKYAHERALKRGDTDKAEMINLQVNMMCACMPGELDVRLSEMTDSERGKLISLEELKGLVNPVMYKCSAPQLRSFMSSKCAEEPSLGKGISDRAAYCDCFSKKLQEVDDATIGEESVKSYLNFQAKAKAIRDGVPVPKQSKKPDIIDQIDKACITNVQ